MGMERVPIGSLPPLNHTFTHFKLRIHPQLLQVINYPRKKTATEIWLTIDKALQLAIPVPVRKILLELTSGNRF